MASRVSDVTHALALALSGTEVGLIHDQASESPCRHWSKFNRADRSSEQGLRYPSARRGRCHGSLRELVVVEHKTIERSIYHKNLRRRGLCYG